MKLFAKSMICIFFFLLGHHSLNAEPVDTTASLTFHLHQLSTADELDRTDLIPFSAEEEFSLWNRVLTDDCNNLALKEAYAEFLEAKKGELEGNKKKYITSYKCAFEILSAHWKNQKDSESDLAATLNILPKDAQTYNDFETNPYITSEARELIRPFLLPANHPMRQAMDTIFLPTRVVQDKNSFQNAGFEILFTQPRSLILVGQHPLLPDYLIKANLDITLALKGNKPAWLWFVRRCVGVAQIDNIIENYKIQNFVTPKKYIYPFPIDPSPPDTPDYSRKIIVLLVDDMHLVDKKTNQKLWKTAITKKHLNELYIIISRAKGWSYRSDNIPFTKDKKIAFIDTEYPTSKPDFLHIRKSLSHSMLVYWDKIVANGGPKN